MSTRKKQQHGLTLIELMVSLAIGLVVSLVAVQLFATGISSFALQRGLGDVNESGRFGLEFLAKNIQSSGYVSADTAGNKYNPVIVQTTDMVGSTAATVGQNNAINLGLGSSDQLVVRTWIPATSPAFTDCEGNSVPNTAQVDGLYVVSRYFLRTDTTTNSTALACDAGYYTKDATAVTNYGDTGVVLMSFVENFQVLYGIATATTSIPIRFVTAADYITLGKPKVVAVRVGAVVRSAEKAGNLPSTVQSINVLGEEISATTQNAAGAGIPRRLFVKTIALRNNA